MIDTYEMINNTSLPMSDETRLNMSARMQRLMRESAGLDAKRKPRRAFDCPGLLAFISSNWQLGGVFSNRN